MFKLFKTKKIKNKESTLNSDADGPSFQGSTYRQDLKYENEKPSNLNICNHKALPIFTSYSIFNPPEGYDHLIRNEWSKMESITFVNDINLGFSVAGMKNMKLAVKTVVHGGVADRDGRLQRGDQILQIYEFSKIGSEEFTNVLEETGSHVRLIIAQPVNITSIEHEYLDNSALLVPTRLLNDIAELDRYLVQHNHPNMFLKNHLSLVDSNNSKTGSDQLLQIEWSQLGIINLIDSNKKVGFNIVGTRNWGFLVKSILQGGVADRDGRLRRGDYILQVRNINLHEMSSNQQTTDLRQPERYIRLIVARPTNVISKELEYLGHSPVFVPTALLSDRSMLDRYLIRHNYLPIHHQDKLHMSSFRFDQSSNKTYSDLSYISNLCSLPLLNFDPSRKIRQKKNCYDLSYSVPIIEKEELSGVNIVTILNGSGPDLTRKILVNDRIIKMVNNLGSADNIHLQHNSHESVRAQVQQKDSEIKLSSSPSDVARHSAEALLQNRETNEGDDARINKTSTIQNIVTIEKPIVMKKIYLKSKWKKILGPGVEIIVAKIKIFNNSGLGIDTEGGVAIEDGKEVRRHHYISSIKPEGPIGKNGTFQLGDELLEINGYAVRNIKSYEVNALLKKLPIYVLVVCGRRIII